jgi:hypothetical protein
MIHPDPETAPDDATRLSRLCLACLREGRIADARTQLEALHDVTPRSPWLDLNELQAGPRPGPKAADQPVPYTLTAKAEAMLAGLQAEAPAVHLEYPERASEPEADAGL